MYNIFHELAKYSENIVAGLPERIIDEVDCNPLSGWASLRAQGLGQSVIEPRMHLVADKSFAGHFNVLPGYLADSNTAGINIVGDYHNYYQQGLPYA